MMKIEILGPGCSKCEMLHQRTLEVSRNLPFTAEVVKVEDINRMVELGLWASPGFVIDDKVLFAGRVPGVKELTQIIMNHAGE